MHLVIILITILISITSAPPCTDTARLHALEKDSQEKNFFTVFIFIQRMFYFTNGPWMLMLRMKKMCEKNCFI